MACLGDVASGDADSGLLIDMLDVIHGYAVASKVCVVAEIVPSLS